jgi:endothelin-converting enzyme/putative endopeptidase
MSPPTVNAYYDPQNNNINFPAGILQPPFFDAKIDDAVNLGAIGAVIGHELTHGFDDQGRQFDAEGNMKDWWLPADAKEFEQRARCIEEQYGGYTAVADVKLNGKLTLGENVADNGGLRIAYMALMELLEGRTRPKIDGYTPEQRFFLGWAQVWCTADRDETARLRAITDPHSPARYRVNGTLSNMPVFHRAFGCRAGQPLVSDTACRVW